MDGPLRVVLVDDHPMVLEGLKAMLARRTREIRIVGQATNSDEAFRVVGDLRPDIVVLDVRLGQDSGLDVCIRLIARDPACRVVFLTVYDDEQYLFQALRAGAVGYLLKRVDGRQLVEHLQAVHAGEIVIDAALAGRATASAARLAAGEYWPGAHLGLTQRESEVLSLMVAGHHNRAIASRLVVGEETVKSHVSSVYRKLDVSDRSAAVATALREGLFH
ncbi:MAG: response regulator transcription factor [Geodermatophilaceae bacterium]|nr:response regulator transcription factor [Geodermatophilaceae bacterium]